MKLRKELIGSQVWCVILNKYFTIEEGNEKMYKKIGLDVFEAPETPKLQTKKKTNGKTTKGKRNNVRSNTKRTNNNKQS